MFHLGDRHNTVQNGAEAHAGQEAERVTNVADRMTSLGLDPFPGIIFRLCTASRDLQTPLLGEKKSDRGDFCVLVMADVVTVADFAGWVAVESHRRV